MAKHELSANDTCALSENERKRSTNLVQQVYVEHLENASQMAKHELSANDTCALNENERKRSTNLVQQVYVEHLENASQRLIEIFINT